MSDEAHSADCECASCQAWWTLLADVERKVELYEQRMAAELARLFYGESAPRKDE